MTAARRGGQPYGFGFRPIRGRARQGDEAEMIRLYGEGQTLAQAGARFGVPGDTVARVLDRHGVARRPAGGRQAPPPDPDAIAAAYLAGLTVREVAAKFHTADKAVKATLSARSIPRRGGTPPPPPLPAWREKEDTRRAGP